MSVIVGSYTVGYGSTGWIDCFLSGSRQWEDGDYVGFEATMRITFGGGTLELTNQADTALVASILSMLRGHWGLTP